MEEFEQFPQVNLFQRWLHWRLEQRNRKARVREGYFEQCSSAALESWIQSLSEGELQELTESLPKDKFEHWAKFLSLVHIRQNASTLVQVSRALGTAKVPIADLKEQLRLKPNLQAAEFGAHTFSRAPALMELLRKIHPIPNLSGFELAPFPSPFSLHSVYDIARHNCRSVPNTKYAQADYRKIRDKFDVIFCFYPFVSPDPAHAWGIPKNFSSANDFFSSLARCLHTRGIAIVVHQGAWEQKIADDMLSRPNIMLERLSPPMEYRCCYLPTEHSAFISIYRRL